MILLSMEEKKLEAVSSPGDNPAGNVDSPVLAAMDAKATHAQMKCMVEYASVR